MRVEASIVAVLLLAGFAATAAADSPSPSPADAAFVRSLADPELTLPEVGVPEPQLKSCNVSVDCGDGNIVACTGNSSCQTTIAGVKCDGNEVQCPNFCSIGMSCDCCNGPYNTACWSRRGDCQYTGGGISCNGVELTCQSTCPLCPEW
jgi:hypothetical protein